MVTIKTLEGDTVEDFANHLFQKWGVGYKGTDRGVMVLLATDDHKYWTEVGYGLEPILPDGKVGGFGRSMVPLLRQGNYNGAVVQMVSQIAEVIAQDSHVSLDSLAGFPAAAPAARDGEGQEMHLTAGQIILLFIVFIVVVPILLSFWPILLFLSCPEAEDAEAVGVEGVLGEAAEASGVLVEVPRVGVEPAEAGNKSPYRETLREREP